jgi:leader peptidase (prepilin peptidase) / N-methyltransferase
LSVTAETQTVAAETGGTSRVTIPAAAAVVAALCLVRVEPAGDGLIAAFTGFLLVWLAAIDFRERVLPDRVVLPAIVVVLVAHAVVEPHRLAECLVGAAAAGAAFLVPALLRPSALGMGDVKLAVLLGAALGHAVVPALTVGLFLAGLFAGILLALQGRTALKSELALGPFLAFGALVVLLA